MGRILATCNECGADCSHQIKDRGLKTVDSQATACYSCGSLVLCFVFPDKTEEELATERQRELVEKHGMLGMMMNPYKPFDVVIDWDYEEQRLLRELESVRKAKAEAHLTLEERSVLAFERLAKVCEEARDTLYPKEEKK